jgi:NADPH-dependent ferric siderophore reductase
MVAQYAPDYSMGALAMDDTAHHNLFSSYFKSGLQPVSPSNGRSVDGLLDWVTGQGFCTTHTWFYLAGNHNLVSALRHELRALGFLSSQIRVKGFWS